MLPLILFALSCVLRAQQVPSATQPPAGGNWQHVKALPANTKVHITTDHGGKTCRIFAVSDDTLTCAKGGNTAGNELQRAEIRHIKLAHVVRSTLVGGAIGFGVGATAGAIGGRTKPCPTGQAFCSNGVGIVSGADAAAIGGVAGAVLGSVVGGTTDFARGSSIYTRP
jgi:hypothetical protein